MNSFIRYIGAILLLVGVLIIAIPGFMGTTTNTTLVLGLILEIIGFALHIILGKRAMSNEEKEGK
ncbi:hypothetical protein HMPREF1869_00399 [Bacteroidales bacterium KA00251]|nr:hypothetical protein HMPREF1869_00399 [Bacteroidales bacterium KA00251]